MLQSNTNTKLNNLLLRAKELVSKTKKTLLKHTICKKQTTPVEFYHDCNAWLDIETNLLWEIKTNENISTIYTYEEALRYAQELNKQQYCSLDNWKIPTLEELMTIYSKDKHNNFYIKKALSKNTDWAYWSTTENIVNSYVFYFNDGTKRNESKYFRCYVRCVCVNGDINNE